MIMTDKGNTMRSAPGLKSIFAAVGLLVFAGSVNALDTDVYYAARIWTCEAAPIQDGVLVVVDGKIAAIGEASSTQVPANATRHDLGGGVIIPGLVVPQSDLSQNPDNEQALTPQVLALDGFDFFEDHHRALSGGVTSIQISPGNNRLMPGVGSVVKLGNGEPSERVLLAKESLRINLNPETRDPPTIYEPPVGPVSVDRPLNPTQPQLGKSLSTSLAGLRAALRAVQSDRQFVVAGDDDVVFESISELIRDGLTVRIDANGQPEIRGAVNLANEFSLNLVLVDPHSLESFESEFSKWRERVLGVVVKGASPGKIDNPEVPVESRPKPAGESLPRLIEADIPFAIRSASDADLADMLFVAGLYRKFGLSTQQVLNAITLWPAKMMAVDERVGSLSTGKDADFVVLSNDPFEVRANVVATYVNGERVYETKAEIGQPTTLIRAKTIHTGGGAKLNDAALVVRGSTVRGMGDSVSAPTSATVRDFGDAVIVPGFVDLGSTLGVGGSLSGNVSLDSKLGEQLFADDPAIKFARKSGVTTVLMGSLASSQPTPMTAFKLDDTARVLADPVAIRFRLTGNLVSTRPAAEKALKQGKEYFDSWVRYEKELAEYEARKAQAAADASAQETDVSNPDSAENENEEASDEENDESTKQNQRSRGGRERTGNSDSPRDGSRGRRRPPAENDDDAPPDETQEESPDQSDADEKDQENDSEEESPPKKPEVKEALEPYRRLFTGEIPAFVEARKLNEIQAALELFRDQYQLRTVIVGGDDLVRKPELLDGHTVSVCAGPDLLISIDESRSNIPQLLSNERIEFGFQSAASSGVAQLPEAVKFSVNQGLGTRDALVALTSAPARMLGGNLAFGSIAPGKDADLVVLSGPPFELSTEILAVMIDGQWVYEKENER